MSAYAHGIRLKKKHGQYFLKDCAVVCNMLAHVTLTSDTSVLEIGCGDGFLTGAILQSPIKRLWVYEIDPEWANYVRVRYPDTRLTIFQENFLDISWELLFPLGPWTVLSNIPYHVTFPILEVFRKRRTFLREGVIMVQEEVAQKLVKTSGRGYGFISLYFQHFFNWYLLQQVPPSAFTPQPKVTSRLIYFRPRFDQEHIPNEEQFWRFIKLVFASPRRTLKNNLAQGHYDTTRISPQVLSLRAQQLSKQDLLELWSLLL